MSQLYSLGPYKGELVLDLDGLFHVIRLIPPFPEASALERAVRKNGIPTLIFIDARACLVTLEAALWGPTDQAWEAALLDELRQKDPISAEEAVEQALQTKILTEGRKSLEDLMGNLSALERYLDAKLVQARQRKQFGLVAELARRLEELQDAQDRLVKAARAFKPFATYQSVTARGTNPKATNKPAPEAVNRATARGRGGTPQKTYRLPLLQALQELGGRSTTIEALQRVFDHMKSRLVPEDLEYIVHGRKKEAVWMNRARWEIAALKEEGLIQSGGYGILVLTQAGRNYLEVHGGTG